MTGVAIVGNGGHGRMLLQLFRRRLDGTLREKEIGVYPHDAHIAPGIKVAIGLGNGPKIGDSDLKRRAGLYEEYANRVVGVQDPSAVLIGDYESSAQVFPLAVINWGAYVGHNTIINTGAIVEHDCHVDKHCHIAPRAVLCGRVRVGAFTHIGSGAIVRQGIKIGSCCVIAMGAVVIRDVLDGQTWLKGEVL